MSSSSPPESSGSSPRGPVDDLVAQVLAGDPAEVGPRLEDACRRHPEHATVLRRRLELLVDTGLVDLHPAGGPARPEVPERLGEFRLLEPIGQGGMGVVYRARQDSLGRDVALKLVRPEELRFPGAHERFAREVTTIARLSHPGIVPVYAVGEEGGVPYFAMELVRGATLAQLLAVLSERDAAERTGQRGEDLDRALAELLGEAPADEPAPLFGGTWEQACLRIVRDVAWALEHAHGSNVLHRDLKPSNIMLTREGRVMLLDFGLSSVEGSDRLTRTGVQVGSFAYMAPELLTDAASADRRSDVYSLGVTLYELLAGRLPYRARSLAGLRTQVLQAHPASLRRGRERRRRVSWEAETVCLVAMDPDRARRYGSAGALARDLDNALEGRPLAARRPGVALRTRRFAARHPAWSAGVALLALAVPVTWAVQESRGRARIAEAKERSDALNVALTESLEEVRRQQARADENFVLARDAVDRMLDHLGDVRLRDVPHLETLRRDVLRDALAFHEALVGTEPEDERQRLEYARSLRRVAEMHSLLSEFDQASATLGREQALLEQWLDEAPDERLVEELAQVVWRLVEAENYRGRLDEALRLGQLSRELLLEHGVETPAERLRLARLELQLARALQRSGRAEEAHEILLRSVGTLRDLRQRGELVGDGPGLLATALASLGEPRVYMVAGDRSPDELEVDAAYLQEALGIRRGIAAQDPTPDSRFAVFEALNSLAGSLYVRGRIEEAIGTYREARELVEGLVEEFPSVAAYLDARAATYLNLGAQYATLSDDAAAEEAYERAVESYARLHSERPEQRGLGVRRLIALQSLAEVRVSLGRFTDDLLATIEQAQELGADLARQETGEGAALVARLRPRLELLHGFTLVALGRADEVLERARVLEEDGSASAEPLLRAGALVALCVGAEEDEPLLRAELVLEAVDCLARGLDREPAPEQLASWLSSEALDPLRGERAFVELLESRGLERWIER